MQSVSHAGGSYQYFIGHIVRPVLLYLQWNSFRSGVLGRRFAPCRMRPALGPRTGRILMGVVCVCVSLAHRSMSPYPSPPFWRGSRGGGVAGRGLREPG